MVKVNSPLIKQVNIFFYHGFFSHTWTFKLASRKRDRTFHFHPSTNIQTFSYQDVCSLFLIDLFVIHKLAASELYPPSGFVFNPTRTELFWELGLRGDLVVPRNVKVNNSTKNYYSLKKVGRNIVVSIINQNMKKYWHMSIMSSYDDIISDIFDIINLTSWKYYFFSRINNYCSEYVFFFY